MKEEQENIDDLIKQALSEEESEILERLDEQSIFEQVMSTYQGKMKWLGIYVTFLILVFTVLLIYCLVEFLRTEDIRQMLLWGAGMGASFLMVMMLKIWKFMQMNKNTLLREIKRLELHIAALHKNKS